MKGQDGVDLVQDIRVVVYMETQSCCLIPPTFSIATHTQRPAYAHFHPVSGIRLLNTLISFNLSSVHVLMSTLCVSRMVRVLVSKADLVMNVNEPWRWGTKWHCYIKSSAVHRGQLGFYFGHGGLSDGPLDYQYRYRILCFPVWSLLWWTCPLGHLWHLRRICLALKFPNHFLEVKWQVTQSPKIPISLKCLCNSRKTLMIVSEMA